MTVDWYRDLTSGRVGGAVAAQVGLPRPAHLRRYAPGQALVDGPVMLTAAGRPRLEARIRSLLAAAGARVTSEADGAERLAAIVIDATGVDTIADLAHVHATLGPGLRHLGVSGRVVVLASPPEATERLTTAAARRALEGVVRSVAKEGRYGATANLLVVDEDADAAVDSPLSFFLSGRSAYVSGQVVRVSAPVGAPGAPTDPLRPLDGRIAVVTGAAQGIGAATAEVLARDGATVVCVDLPAQGEALAAVANRVGGSALQLDITAEDAPGRLLDHLRGRHDGVDVVVHNAGITRDKLLANMDADRWGRVLAVNLDAQVRINDALVADADVLRPGARVVCVSSVSGIAGNRGQANYAASKAGVIGMVGALADVLAARGATVNAVAPGFIETEMTAAMPFATREVGRRSNSLRQGGLPVDVAETVAWLAQEASAGVNGQVVRVCGQSLIGA